MGQPVRTLDSPTRRRLVALLDAPVRVLDVGCRGGVADVWTAYGEHVHVVGFDPDARECARLAAGSPPWIRFVPQAASATPGPRALHVTVDPACSSLYPPGPVVDTHPALAVARPKRTTMIECTTIDAWCEAEQITFDAVKIDVQGAALDVLCGASRQLAAVIALEVEVEFTPIYRGQPLFADVDSHLRARGFDLWRLRHLVHYSEPDPPEVEVFDAQFFDDAGVPIPARGGRLFWGIATYVRRDVLLAPERRSRAQHARSAVVFEGLGLPDLAVRSARRALT
jgi:FkbM family methyltransferase